MSDDILASLVRCCPEHQVVDDYPFGAWRTDNRIILWNCSNLAMAAGTRACPTGRHSGTDNRDEK